MKFPTNLPQKKKGNMHIKPVLCLSYIVTPVKLHMRKSGEKENIFSVSLRFSALC